MTDKPKRRRSSAHPVPSPGSFWSTIASYTSELAPVAGPLLEAIGQTASAIDRAERQTRAIEAAWEELED